MQANACNQFSTILASAWLKQFREHGSVGPSEIYERYTEEVDDPRTKRTIRTYLSKMEQYNLLEAEGTSRDREYATVESRPATTTI